MKENVQVLFGVAFCGALGAMARFGVSQWQSRSGTEFPVATLIVNVLGCFLLGALFFAPSSAGISPTWRTALGAGLLGALTTFSTFGVETYDRAARGMMAIAVTNVLANLCLGLLAVFLGKCFVLWICNAPLR